MQSELGASLARIVGIDEQKFNLTGADSLACTCMVHHMYEGHRIECIGTAIVQHVSVISCKT